MAKTLLNVIKSANGGIYTITVSWRCSDKEHEVMLDEHGPTDELEMGGVFTETLPVVGPITVTLPSVERTFPDQFPYTITFDAVNYGNDHTVTMNMANAWIQHITKSGGVIQTGLQTLWTEVGSTQFEDSDTYELETI